MEEVELSRLSRGLSRPSLAPLASLGSRSVCEQSRKVALAVKPSHPNRFVWRAGEPLGMYCVVVYAANFAKFFGGNLTTTPFRNTRYARFFPARVNYASFEIFHFVCATSAMITRIFCNTDLQRRYGQLVSKRKAPLRKPRSIPSPTCR